MIRHYDIVTGERIEQADSAQTRHDPITITPVEERLARWEESPRQSTPVRSGMPPDLLDADIAGLLRNWQRPGS